MVFIALLLLLGYLTVGLTLWAPISAIHRPARRYPNGKGKEVWVAVLLAAVVAQAVTTLIWAFPFPAGSVAAWSYVLLVVRPARRVQVQNARAGT
jgi:hypothetical protein